MGAEGDSEGGEAGLMGGIGDRDLEGEVLHSGAQDTAQVGGVDGEADRQQLELEQDRSVRH